MIERSIIKSRTSKSIGDRLVNQEAKFFKKAESPKSPISNSESPDSLRIKYMKKIAPVFAIHNKHIQDPDLIDIFLRRLYNDSKYKLTNDLEKIYPFENLIYDMNVEYLGLNHNIYNLIPEIVKRINNGHEWIGKENQHDTKSKRLLRFYYNLAKNTNKKVIPYLKEIYDVDHDSNKLNWPDLCKNPNAIKILTEEYKRDPNKLVWDALCENKNPEIIKIIEEEYKNNPNSNKLNWNILSGNPKAINLLTIKINEEKKLSNSPESRRKKINWKKISGNPKAIKIIEEEYKKVPNKLDWDALCANENPEVIKIIEEEYKKDHNSANINWDILSGNPKAINLLTIKINEEKKLSNSRPESRRKKINWEKLSGNRKAIRLLKANIQKIYWNSLSGNTNPKAIQLLKDRTIIKVYGLFENEHIDWDILSGNPNAINLIIDRLKMEIQPYWYPDGIEGKNKINWSKLLANPSIFTVNSGSVQFTEQEKN